MLVKRDQQKPQSCSEDYEKQRTDTNLAAGVNHGLAVIAVLSRHMLSLIDTSTAKYRQSGAICLSDWLEVIGFLFGLVFVES